MFGLRDRSQQLNWQFYSLFHLHRFGIYRAFVYNATIVYFSIYLLWFKLYALSPLETSSQVDFYVFLVQSVLKFKLNYFSGTLQWNPDFSNHGKFPLDLLQSNTVILPRFFEPSIFRNSWYFEPILASHAWKIYKKFTFDFSSAHEIFNVLLSSFHLNGHTSQTEKVELPSIYQLGYELKISIAW